MERHRVWQAETDAQERSSLIYFAPASQRAPCGIAKRHRWMVGSNEVREIQAPPGAKSWIRSR